MSRDTVRLGCVRLSVEGLIQNSTNRERGMVNLQARDSLITQNFNLCEDVSFRCIQAAPSVRNMVETGRDGFCKLEYLISQNFSQAYQEQPK